MNIAQIHKDFPYSNSEILVHYDLPDVHRFIKQLNPDQLQLLNDKLGVLLNSYTGTTDNDTFGFENYTNIEKSLNVIKFLQKDVKTGGMSNAQGLMYGALFTSVIIAVVILVSIWKFVTSHKYLIIVKKSPRPINNMFKFAPITKTITYEYLQLQQMEPGNLMIPIIHKYEDWIDGRIEDPISDAKFIWFRDLTDLEICEAINHIPEPIKTTAYIIATRGDTYINIRDICYYANYAQIPGTDFFAELTDMPWADPM
jgi:hypothetical protein